MVSKHPAGLTVLFLTEMWERFGFYIVQGMLVLFLTQAWHWSDEQSYAITGAFTAFVYLSPILGGYVADNILGYKTAITAGGILLVIGYAVLALSETFLYFALAIVIVGNGLFKPNIASLLGSLYDKDDTHREAGFTIFYMGINLGVILATLSSGFIKDWFGWWAGFALASVGLLVGVINFIIGAHKFKGYGLAPKLTTTTRWSWLHSKKLVVLGVIVLIPLLALLIKEKNFVNILLLAAGIGLLILLASIAYKQQELYLRNRMLALTLLGIISIIFWAIFFQIFFSLNLFIDRDINRSVFGYQIPTIAFISFESIFIILTGPILARLWYRLNTLNKNPSIPAKFFLGFVLTGIAFLILALSTRFHDAQGLINPWWIPLGYFFITVGEMCISPISLSAVTYLSPPRWVGMMMGVYLISIGYGGKLAGVIANFSAVPKNLTDPILESQYYGSAFVKYALLAFVASIIMLCFVPLLNRLIKKPALE